MPLDLALVLHAYALLGILVEKFDEQILRLRRNVLRDLQLCILDVFIEFLYVLCVVGRESNQELVEDRTYLIDITRLTYTLAQKHLWGQVGWRPAKRLGLALIVDAFLGQTEVGKFDVTFCVNQDVLWLQISVYHIQVVYVLHSQNDLSYVETRLVLIEDLPLIEMEGKVAARAVIQDHVQVLRCLEREVQLYYIGVIR